MPRFGDTGFALVTRQYPNGKIHFVRPLVVADDAAYRHFLPQFIPTLTGTTCAVALDNRESLGNASADLFRLVMRMFRDQGIAHFFLAMYTQNPAYESTVSLVAALGEVEGLDVRGIRVDTAGEAEVWLLAQLEDLQGQAAS